MSENSMKHPLILGVEDKTTEELVETVAKLNKNLVYAGRTNNYAMVNQITMALNSYRSELNKREQEEWDSQEDDDEDDLGNMISIQ